MFERLKTAIILLIIVAIALFASSKPWLFLLFLLVGGVISAYEWTNLIPKYKLPLRFVVLVFGVSALSLMIQASWLIWWLLALVIWLLALVWVKQYPAKTRWYGKRLWIMGLIIHVSTVTAMYYLWGHSPWWLLYVFSLVWVADSGAYFAGRAFGRHAMAPKVSPKKTLEGLAGGILAGCLVATWTSRYQLALSDATLIIFLVLSVITVLFSVLGDLYESMLKRRAGIKDSGTILPGHGGVLDRIDSVLAAMPIFAIGHWLLGGFV